MKCSEVIEKLEELSPVAFAEKWDNVGLVIGNKEKEIRKVMIAVDATEDVILQALKYNADMLLTHHPMILSGEKNIISDDFIGKRIITLIKNDICCYAMHTNFDVMGMADAAADVIGLRDRKVLDITYEDEIAKEGCGRFGKLSKMMTLEQCANHVKKEFKIDSVRVYGDRDLKIEKCAIMPGSGGDYIEHAIQAGVEVLVTGDIKHHQGIDACAKGLAIIDAGHYELEKIFVPYMEEFFCRNMNSLTVCGAKESVPFWVL